MEGVCRRRNGCGSRGTTESTVQITTKTENVSPVTPTNFTRVKGGRGRCIFIIVHIRKVWPLTTPARGDEALLPQERFCRLPIAPSLATKSDPTILPPSYRTTTTKGRAVKPPLNVSQDAKIITKTALFLTRTGATVTTSHPATILTLSTTAKQQPAPQQHNVGFVLGYLHALRHSRRADQKLQRSTTVQSKTAIASELTQSTRCLGGIKKYVKTCTNGQKRHPVVTTPFSLPFTVSRVSSHESPRSKLT